MRFTESPILQLATDCVEAGVDFSFHAGLRDLSAWPAQTENWEIVDLIQIAAGRASLSEGPPCAARHPSTGVVNGKGGCKNVCYFLHHDD